MKISETTINGELYTHKLLWNCCSQQVKAANEARNNSSPSYYFEISAMLLAYMTFESYVNFLGDRLAPEIWVEEKSFFNKKPYKGLEGKLKFLFEKLKIEPPPKGERPYQTFQKLNQLRTYLAHGKPDKYTKKIVHTTGEAPPLFHSKLDTLTSPKSAKIAVEDVEKFINWLHEKAKEVGDEFWLEREALDGIVEFSFGDTRTKIPNK